MSLVAKVASGWSIRDGREEDDYVLVNPNGDEVLVFDYGDLLDFAMLVQEADKEITRRELS